LREGSGEIGLAGEFERECNVDQRPIVSRQQRFGMLETFCADVLMRRSAEGGLERSREMEPAQACNRRQVFDREIAFQVCLYVVQHPPQSASIKAFLSEMRQTPDGRRAEMALNESRRQT
jgi:hypothetical protein